MYDWPELRAATDQWWQGIARHLAVDIPLSRLPHAIEAWQRPDLLLAQTCGYPFTHGLKGRVKLVATPHYDADGCDGANYRSILFAREARPLREFRDLRAAVNTPDSMSGMLALKLVFASYADGGRFFGSVVETGSHLNSLEAVREGRADLCATDCVCVALAKRHRPQALDGLVEIARSPAVPGLPLITQAGDVQLLRTALQKAFADPDLARARKDLLLSGYSVLDPSAYDRIIALEAEMEKQGGLALL
ncbi:phosphate/phosphite/phosphonate ABC transporter substrate-binding protein [Aestuariivirga sp.]|uniref:phosphate/phosphite/phosphonate ABC transporter substrate-binding protein n=1 Tax=Aestuariivirga sp. TaxID=2650926 RepID=UPI003BABB653